MNYLIGSSYCNPISRPRTLRRFTERFAQIWCDNVAEQLTVGDVVPIVISDSASGYPRLKPSAVREWIPRLIHMTGNLGSCHELLNNLKPHRFNGWSGAMTALALLAYVDERDFIYWEQDVLCFGDAIGEMYREIGDAGIIFGSYVENGFHCMPCAQSLFLVKHAFIPEFASTYLSSPAQNVESELGEHKFSRFETGNPSMWKRFTFGVDRARPLPWDEPIWYAQHWTPEEILEARERGLI